MKTEDFKLTIITSSKDAIELSESAQLNIFQDVLSMIKSDAERGFRETLLVNCYLSLANVSALIKMGFMVGEYTIPFDGRKVQKISW
jgi:hypothetical protein